MSENYVMLKDVCDKASSNIAQKDLLSHEGPYPIYGASGFIKNVDFFQREEEYIAVVKDGAGIGRTFKLPAQSSVIGTMQYILPKGNIDISYLYYAICAMHLEKYFSGATIPHIYFRDYQKEKLRLPSLDVQKRTAFVLDTIESIIAKRKQQLSKLDELVKSRFIEMFGREKYEPKILGEIACITGGLTKNSMRKYFPLKYKYLRVANVLFNQFDLNEVLEIGVQQDEIERTLLKIGDLLFVEGNGSIEQIGRVAVWNDQIANCLHQNHLIKARFNLSIVNPIYAMYYFMLEEGRSQIVKKSVSTSGLHTLSVKKIGSLMLPVPQLALQNKFVDFVKSTDKSKTAIQKSLDELETLKKSLMQQYFG